MQTDDGESTRDSLPGGSGPPGQPPPMLPVGGAQPPTQPPLSPAPGEPGPESSNRGRRTWLALAGVAGAVVFIAAGFGLAQLVDRDSVDATSSSVASADTGDPESAASPPGVTSPDGASEPAPEALEPGPPSLADQLPFLDQLPIDPQELERLFNEFQEQFGDDFAIPFDEIPLPEDLPNLDELPVDPDQLRRLFEEFRQQFGDDFAIPFDEGDLEGLLEGLREQFGDSLVPGPERPDLDRESSENGDEA